jgi:F-type H+-transporting ATPase subunit b
MRRLLLPLLLAGAPAIAPAWAQEAPPKGMPQLDFGNPLTISQVVWLVIIFAVLYLLLSSWALPKVGVVLNDRATRIATDLDTARAAKAEADRAADEVRQAGKRAHQEAQAEINAAIAQAKQQAAEQAAALTAALEARIEASEAEIARARAAAMASLAEVAAEVAASMVHRLTGQPPAPHAVAAAIGALRDQAA